jgi:hypothetical protein
MGRPLEKWEILHVWCGDLKRPHHKYCLTMFPQREWFFFINSNPPMFRKARDLAVTISNFEVNCLPNRESFIDVTVVEKFPDDRVQRALADESNRMGSFAPFLQDRVRAALNLTTTHRPDTLAILLA